MVRFLGWVGGFGLLAGFSGLTSSALQAQDVGMGTRSGGDTRFEVPYSLEIETPHSTWAKPLVGGPLRVLAVPSVQEGRTLVELAQRFDLDLTTISIDPAWDVNKWTMAFGDDYGARAERGDLKLVYRYLEETLTGDQEFDVIFLPLHHGWEALTEASRAAIHRRVSQGCGLVLIRPFDEELSPLVGGSWEPPAHPYDEIEPVFESSPWKRTVPHYITRAVPIEAFPFRFLEQYRYRAAAGARVLIEAESGVPVLAEQTVGKGRVLAFGFRNLGMSWRMPFEAKAASVDLYWEYFYALLGRSLIYAAQREPAEAPVFDTPAQSWTLRAEWGEAVRSGTGKPPAFDDLGPGRYFLEKKVRSDWQVTQVDRGPLEQIGDLEIVPKVIEPGGQVTVHFTASGEALVELEDGWGRVIARETAPAAAGQREIRLTAGTPLTHGGLARVTAGAARAAKLIEFSASNRRWEDYEVIMPWYGPRSYEPWTPALDRQFHRLGITTMADPQRPFKVIASVHEPAFGIYWYRRDAYEARKAQYLKTGDKSLIRRDVPLHVPNLAADLEQHLKDRVGDLLPIKPFAYYLADESSLTCYADAWDVDWSPETLTAFRRWLRPRYDENLQNLNRAWDTHFTTWEAVEPMTSTEAQRHGNYAPWSEHRVFMEETFVDTVRLATEIAHRLDPGGLASFSGTQIPTAHNGCNWYEIDRWADYLQPYSEGNQDSMHYLFSPRLKLTGFTGYGLTETPVQAQVWRRLFYGHSGSSLFWHYTLMNPDLTFSPQGKGLARVFNRLESGLGRLFMNSRVVEDGVAVHFSMASIRGAWITDGKILEGVQSATATSENFKELMQRRDDWVEALEQRGIQFRFLATPQIEAGALRDYKVLILPYSIALSDREIEEIERFAEHGGQVYFDEQTGRMDEKCRWRPQRDWPGERPGFRRMSPADCDLQRAIPIRGDFLTTIRDFADCRLIGLLPDRERWVRLPETTRTRYDLLRGGRAQSDLLASPADPVLLLERDSMIASLEIDAQGGVHLHDENGRPVERSVVAVRVLDPDGRDVPAYAGNLDVREGSAQIEIPFALNDPGGRWTVVARDVISGLEASRSLQR